MKHDKISSERVAEGRVTVPKCLECGRMLEFINPSHLRKHGLTVAEYKTKYPDAKFASEDYSEKSRKRFSGEGNPMFGRKHSAEAIERMRKAKTGKKLREDLRFKMWMVYQDPERRKKISEQRVKRYREINEVRIRKYYGFDEEDKFVPVYIGELKFVHDVLYGEGESRSYYSDYCQEWAHTEWQNTLKDSNILFDDWGVCPKCGGICQLVNSERYGNYFYHKICLEIILDKILQKIPDEKPVEIVV